MQTWEHMGSCLRTDKLLLVAERLCYQSVWFYGSKKFYLPYFLLKFTINHFPSAGFGCTLASSSLACFLPFTFLSIKNVPVVNSSIFKEYIPKKSIVKSSTLLQLIKSCYTLSCMTLTHIATMMRSFHVSWDWISTPVILYCDWISTPCSDFTHQCQKWIIQENNGMIVMNDGET